MSIYRGEEKEQGKWRQTVAFISIIDQIMELQGLAFKIMLLQLKLISV